MKVIERFDFLEQTIERIKSKGAFLVVQSEDNTKTNVMTIGWAALGYIWGKPLMIIMVRKSRYTFQIIEEAFSFTVNIPLKNNELDQALTFCGTASGRNTDKFKDAKLITTPAQKINTPIIKHTHMSYFECKIVYKSAIDPESLCPAYLENIYPEKDFHTMYFGEILNYYQA